MIFIYYFLVFLIYIFSIPLLFLFSFKTKYKDSLKKRFFKPDFYSLFDICSFFGAREYSKFRYWIHACSAGEVNSLQEVIRQLEFNCTKNRLDSNCNVNSQNNRDYQILLSVITQTGFRRAKILYPNIKVIYLPFEIFIPFLNLRAKSLVVLEAELWLGLFYYAKKWGAKTTLLNARISTNSFNKYKNMRFFYKYLFRFVDIVLSQSDDDTKRLRQIGAREIINTGNIKALNEIKVTKNYARFNKNVLLLASSHEKNGVSEEEIFLNALLESNLDLDDFYVFIAPRHPERFTKVFGLTKKLVKDFVVKNISEVKLKEVSESGGEQKTTLDSNFLIIDVFGDLINLYAISDIVVLGGSFVNVGGHNPLECAEFNVRLISGKNIFNQLALFDIVENAYIVENEKLQDTLNDYPNLKKSSIKLEKQNEMLENIIGEIK